MTIVLAIPVLLFLLALAFGGLTGRIRFTSGCCAPADPSKDLRMRAAFTDSVESTRAPSDTGDLPV